MPRRDHKGVLMRASNLQVLAVCQRREVAVSCAGAERLLLAAALGLAACRARPTTAPSPGPTARPVPAAKACPAPSARRVKWVYAVDTTGFTLALPPGSREHASGGPARHWDSDSAGRPSISFGIIRGDLGLAGYRRAYQRELMPDYSECTDTVNGYKVSIQAWRTPNGVYRGFRRYDRYDVFAIWEVRPAVFAYITGGASEQPTQVLMLAAIRAWKVTNR
jgi:hypothetical protein